jgi:hypothetical protein
MDGHEDPTMRHVFLDIKKADHLHLYDVSNVHFDFLCTIYILTHLATLLFAFSLYLPSTRCREVRCLTV